MATPQTDILMYMVNSDKRGGGLVPAECQAQIDPTADTMLGGFKAGYFCEIEDANLGLTLVDNDEGAGSDYARWRTQGSKGGAGGGSGGGSGSGAGGSAAQPSFRVEPDPLTFSRLIDSSSPSLMQLCLSQWELKQVVLVKRHLVGGGTPLGFLRIELGTATMRSLGWTDGYAVKENCSLTYQSLLMTFLPRKPSGAALPTKWASWTNTAVKAAGSP